MLNKDQKKLLYKIASGDNKSLRGRDIGLATGASLATGLNVVANSSLSGSYNPLKWSAGVNRTLNSALKGIGVPKSNRINMIKGYKFAKKHPVLSVLKHVSSVAIPTYAAYNIGKYLEKDQNK